MPTKQEVRNARSPSTDNRHQRYLSAASREPPRKNVKRHSNSRGRGSADDPGTSAHGHQHSGHCDGFDLSPKECQTWSLLPFPNWWRSNFLMETLAEYLASPGAISERMPNLEFASFFKIVAQQVSCINVGQNILPLLVPLSLFVNDREIKICIRAVYTIY